jgi:predicted AAA+ superfamily ATPase
MELMEEILYRYNPWWQGKFILRGVRKRDRIFAHLKSSIDKKEIVILTGMRRIGKTTLMRMLIKHLISEKRVKSEKIMYISLDEYIFKDKTLHEIIDTYRSIHRLSSFEEITVFLDEITFLKDYELQLKNLHDLGGVKIYASSSSAVLLKKGQAYITGRTKIIEVPPLDFSEYLDFKGIEILPGDRHLLKKYFEDFMKSGGIPDFVLTGDVSYIKQLVDDIIYKDIAAVHGIKNLSLLKDFFLLLMERAGKSVSVNKIARVLDIAPDTARRYLGLFSDTYLIHLVPRKGKLNEQLRSPKKLYAGDLGIRVQYTGFRDIGSIFENYIYFKIASRDPKFILEDGIEIDFITEDKTLIEVKYYSKMRDKQKKLYEEFSAEKKVVIDSIEKAESFFEEMKVYKKELPMAREPYTAYKASGSSAIDLGRRPCEMIIGK